MGGGAYLLQGDVNHPPADALVKVPHALISLDRLCQITLKHWRLPLDANLQFRGKHEGEFCKQLRSIALLASTDNEAVFC